MSEMLTDGYSTTIVFDGLPNTYFFEREIVLPSLQSGKSIDMTSMKTLEWKGQSPSQLNSLSTISVTVAFATALIPQIIDQVGVNQAISIHFPDGWELFFFGFLESFTPGKFGEGGEPQAVMVIQPSLLDTHQVEFPPFSFDAVPCSVASLTNGGGDTFDCYPVAAFTEYLQIPRAGSGFASGLWLISDKEFGYPYGDSFDGYTVQDPVVKTLDKGEAFSAAWEIL